MKKLILIKFGGSLISDKTKINKARTLTIKKIVRQIKELLQKDKNSSLLIFTGAGGFGHPVAKRYKNSLSKGLPFIRKAVRELNQIVVSTMINYSVPAVGVGPSSISIYNNGKLENLNYESILRLLDQGKIPVFHADLVDDQKLGISILSMDKFLVDCAIYLKNKDLKIEKAVFLGATPVATSEVADRHARTIQKITKNDYFKLKKVFYQGKGSDVTGGMKYKVEQCLRLADEGIDSYITSNLSSRGTLVTSKSAD